MTEDSLATAERTWQSARSSSGYAMASNWAIQNGPTLIAEIRRLRMIVRVNALRHGASHAEVDAVLDGDAA